MRVLQVVDSLDPIYGGPPTVVLRLAAALAGEGCDVSLYSVENPGREHDIERTFKGIPGIDRVQRYSDACDGNIDRLLGRPARDFLRRTASQFDIVHIHGLWRPTLQSLLKESLRQRLPYVITPHGMFARWSLQQKPFRKKLALALGWRALTSKSLFVHALTQAEANDFRTLGTGASVEVVPNGFFLEEIGDLPAPGTFLKAHPELGGQRFVLFLARLHYVKRVDLLVRAFARVAPVIPDVRLVLAGPDCGTRGLVEDLVKTSGLTGRVIFPGPLYGPEKYAAMVDALCFCQTSVYETFSMSILEAMACGLPPIITRGCNFDEVGTSGAGIVVDGDEQPLADALITYCSDHGARGVAAKNARELVVAKYTWPVVARKLMSLYQEQISNRP